MLPLKETDVRESLRPRVFPVCNVRVIRSVPPACLGIEASDKVTRWASLNLGRLVELFHTRILDVRPQTVSDACAVDVQREVDVVAPGREEAVVAACVCGKPETCRFATNAFVSRLWNPHRKEEMCNGQGIPSR